MSEPTRREAIGAIAALSGIQPVAKSNLIAEENARPGSTDWQLTYVKFDAKAKYRQSLIEGYCTRMSVKAGEKLGFCVSVDPASPFTIDVYRMGYYGGTGGRLMKTLGPFEGKPQPTPPVGEHRLRECKWEACTTIEVPKEWPSGVYLGKLSAKNHRYQSYVIFIVADEQGGRARAVQHEHVAGVQQVAGNAFAVRQRPPGQEAPRLRRAGQLRPPLRPLPAGQ